MSNLHVLVDGQHQETETFGGGVCVAALYKYNNLKRSYHINIFKIFFFITNQLLFSKWIIELTTRERKEKKDIFLHDYRAAMEYLVQCNRSLY